MTCQNQSFLLEIHFTPSNLYKIVSCKDKSENYQIILSHEIN